MNATETGKLLGLMALFDNRTLSDPDVVAWLPLVGDLLYGDAQAAVYGHYRDTAERIMPADIRRRVREIRAERVRNAGDLEARVPRELADKPLEYRDWLQRTTQAIADGEPAVRAIGGAA
jgi:hypothetical protein